MKPLTIFACLLALASTLFGQATDEPAGAWTNKAGKSIIAQFVKADDESVTISIKGRRHVLKLSDLSEQSQLLAAELQGEPEPGPETPTEELPAGESLLDKEHEWKNAAGKVIIAKYLSSNDTAVTILMGGRKIP